MEKFNFLEVKVGLPAAGTKQRRVLEALFSRGKPMIEAALMFAHGLDRQAPTMWRQGPYKALASCGLIASSLDAQGITFWELTAAGHDLMKNGIEPIQIPVLQMVAADFDHIAANLPPERPIVMPRTRASHGALKLSSMGVMPIRDGAWEFKEIPSHYASNAGKECE